MIQELALADWLEELAVYSTPLRFQDAETAYHLSHAIKYCYLVRLAVWHHPAPLGTLVVPFVPPAQEVLRRKA